MNNPIRIRVDPHDLERARAGLSRLLAHISPHLRHLEPSNKELFKMLVDNALDENNTTVLR